MKRPRELAELLLEKARQDEVLVDEVLASSRVSDEVIGFHCQQAAEKLLKALLSFREIRFRKTHDLRALMRLLADAGHSLPPPLQELDALSPYVALFRYDAPATPQHLDRQQIRQLVRDLRDWVTGELGPRHG